MSDETREEGEAGETRRGNEERAAVKEAKRDCKRR